MTTQTSYANWKSNHKPRRDASGRVSDLTTLNDMSGATMKPVVATTDKVDKNPPMFFVGASATMMTYSSFTTETGSIDMSPNTLDNDLIDPEEDALRRSMSADEVVKAVMALEGVWADRDDLDVLLDRSDRIDHLYGFLDDPNASV